MLDAPVRTEHRRWLWAFGGVAALCALFATTTEQWVLLGLPVVALVAYWTVVDFRAVWFLLLALIPFSTEINLPGGLGTDLPDEPLMILLAGVYLLYALQRGTAADVRFLRHPITLLLLAALAWSALTVATAAHPFIALKWFLAKCWYLLTFYFLAASVVRRPGSWQPYFWVLFVPLVLTVSWTLLRHYQLDFELRSINRAVRPFYRNKVNYACFLALFTPFVWYQIRWSVRWSPRWWLLVGGLLLTLVGIQYSFTRAAYGALVAAVGVYYLIRYRWMKYALLLATLVVGLSVMLLVRGNQYLELAPNYEQTVSHTNFDNLLTATFQGKDISSMERIYRWVAGANMAADRPWLGFGPGNFYESYRPYTVTSFQTYVSDNEERSGIHSYFLMLLVEQGVPGLMLFVLLTCYVLLHAENLYHRTTDRRGREVLLMLILSVTITDVMLIINDMLEADKVGPFYYTALAGIGVLSLRTDSNGPRSESERSATEN